MMLPASACLQVEATWIRLMEDARRGKREQEMEMPFQNPIVHLLVTDLFSSAVRDSLVPTLYWLE